MTTSGRISSPVTTLPHPLVRLAMELVTRPGSAEPELTNAGRDQLGAALRMYVETPEVRTAAFALLEFAYFLATQQAQAAAHAIGAVVAAEAGEELRAVAAETGKDAATREEAARRFLAAYAPATSAPQPEDEKRPGARGGPGVQFALRQLVAKDKG